MQHVAGIVSEITSATVEQSAGIDLVNVAVTEMDQVTQQNAALVEQVAAAADSMSTQVQRLVSDVSVFRLVNCRFTVPSAPVRDARSGAELIGPPIIAG